jgi:hypothetical protein
MAQSFDTNNIDSLLTNHVSSDAFNVSPARDKMSQGVPTVVELVSLVSEALSELLEQGTLPATIVTQGLQIGPQGLQKPISYEDATVTFDATTDPKFWAWMEAFHNFIDVVYLEPGNGSPNVFATAWKALIAQKPTSLTGKIVVGSQNVKISI